MLPSAVSVSLAAGVSLPGVRQSVALALPSRGARVLPMRCLSSPNDLGQRHVVRRHEVAADDLVHRAVFVDLDQDQPVSAGTETALGVRYRTAWRLKHMIMHAMTEREETRQLAGFVQLDDAYLGGERNGGKVGRGAQSKQPFVIAVSTNDSLEHPTFAVIEPVKGFDNASMVEWGRRRLAPEAEVYSDGLACFRRFADADHAHTVLETRGGRAATEVRGVRWVNVLLGNVKRTISGRYHAIKHAKYARRYLAEAAYRFNRRFRLHEMLPRLLRALVLCKPCPEPSLRCTCNFHG